MAEAPELAPDLSPSLQQRLLELTVAAPPRPVGVRVSAEAIRHWCEAFEDGHPAYLDPTAARRLGHDDVIAPLGALLSTFVLPFRWPWPSDGAKPTRNLHHDVKQLLGFRAAVIGRVAVEHFVDLVVGDVVHVSQRLASVSGLKRTALGEGRFWVVERDYFRNGTILALRETMTSFGYDQGPLAEDSTARSANDAIEESLAGDGGSVPVDRGPDGDSIEVGFVLPRLVMPITPLRGVYVASASRDFAPVHADSAYARRVAGAADAFMSREFHLGMVGRYLTDWGGSRSRVRRIELALRRNLCVGARLSITGRVTGKRQVDAGWEVEVEVEVWGDDVVTSTGRAWLGLAPTSGPGLDR